MKISRGLERNEGIFVSICVCLLMPLFEPDKGKETIYTGYRNLFWMYGHSRAELIYIPLVSGQKRDGNIIQSHGIHSEI